MAEVFFLFSLLSGAKSLASRRQPWPALHKDAALPGSPARRCLNALRKGKPAGKKGPGGTRERWEVCASEPRAPAGPFGHQLLPGRQAAEQRLAATRTRPFVGAKHKEEGKTRLPF